MQNRVSVALAAALAMAVCTACEQGAAKRLEDQTSGIALETGAHWASPTEYAQLKRLGYQFAVITLDRDPDHWREVFDLAERAGIRLIAGLHPYPYRLIRGQWEIESIGQQFIKYAQTRSTLVKALFIFNEPLWVDPLTGRNSPCGALSANELRALRSDIRRIWPQALIYHDFGRASLWAPGGSMERDHACVGNKYADMTSVADYAGIWFYPVNVSEGYRRDEMIRAMREEIAFVTRKIGAEAVALGQAFRCVRCTNGTRMPTAEEARDINCTLRWLGPQAISWYPWRQLAYRDDLAGHRELWSATGPGACFENRGN